MNVSFKANYLANPTLIPKSKTFTDFSTLVNKDTFTQTTQKENTNINVKDKRKKILAFVIGTATVIGIALISLFNKQHYQKKLAQQMQKIRQTQSSNMNRVSQTGLTEAAKNPIWIDLSESCTLKEMSLAKNLAQKAEKIKTILAHPEVIKQRGGEVSNSILLYGPPGTGKTTFAKALAKEFPDAKFASIDIARLKDPYIGNTEKNINNAIDTVFDYAKKHKDTKVFVFLDEIDSIMMVEEGVGAKHSNDFLNVFKRAFTEKLAVLENIVTIGATNLTLDTDRAYTVTGKKLDKAMLDRFKDKVLVDLPTKEQVQSAIASHYSRKNCTLVEDELKNAGSKKLAAISDFLVKHHASFRTLDSIYQDAASSISDPLAKVTIKDIINAIKAKSSELGINTGEIEKLIETISKII